MQEFYNTTNELGDKLISYKDKAITQEEVVILIFKKHVKLTAYKCYDHYIKIRNDNTPLTSIRRAITNLCKKDVLALTTDKEKGCYGRDNYVYEYIKKVI